MDIYDKLAILAEAAKYDASCSSSGNGRTADEGFIGAATPTGCCHSFSADGRCISLLKVLMSNACTYDCKYCISRRSNDFPGQLSLQGNLQTLPSNFTEETI